MPMRRHQLMGAGGVAGAGAFSGDPRTLVSLSTQQSLQLPVLALEALCWLRKEACSTMTVSACSGTVASCRATLCSWAPGHHSVWRGGRPGRLEPRPAQPLTAAAVGWQVINRHHRRVSSYEGGRGRRKRGGRR